VGLSEHHDVRPPNVLWNPETSSVVLVDFERSEILEQTPILGGGKNFNLKHKAVWSSRILIDPDRTDSMWFLGVNQKFLSLFSSKLSF